MRTIITKLVVFSILHLLIAGVLQAQQVLTPDKVVTATYFDVTPPLRDMPLVAPGLRDRTWKNQIVKNHFGFLDDMKNMEPPAANDPLLQSKQGGKQMRSVNLNIEGVNNLNGVAPADTDGDIGPNHYFQIVNLAFAIFSREGALLYGPADNKTLWDGFIGPWTGTNDGDPIVLYDEAADRWMVSQFAIYTSDGTQWELVAVSQTGDPTGAWYRYAFQFTWMPDYPKFGIWSDGYYLSVNQFEKVGSTYNWKGGGACVLNRSKMLAGDPSAEMVFFNLGVSYGGLLPADIDGDLPPAGTPGYFARISSNSLQMWSLTANWNNPQASSLLPLPAIPVASFSNQGINVTQPATTQTLASIADRLMYRLQYRNVGDFQALVTNHTVNNGAGQAAVRWYELRKTGANWTLYQQGTYAPADGNSRWMASAAMNASGDIALGYSVSGNATYPSIRYTGRNANDAPGTMTWEETSIFEGSNSQNNLNRWGDYSCMAVDPSNDEDFWFTSEYTTGGWSWRTRIASFSPVPAPLPQIMVSTELLEFGNVVPGNPAVKSFIIQNTGNAQLVVNDVTCSHPDFLVSPASLIVEPGGQFEIFVDFFPSSAGFKEGLITIFSNDPVYPELSINVSGTGILPAPENLQALVNDHDVSLTWEPAQVSSKGFLGYLIFRQGSQINAEPVVETTYLDGSVPGGEWHYQVAAAYNEGVSELTLPVAVMVGKPQIVTNILSITDTLISGDSVTRQLIVKNTGDLPLHFDLNVGFDYKAARLPKADYCIPASNCSQGRRLDHFVLDEISNLSSGCSTNGYGDFTGMTTKIEAGQTLEAGFKGGISKMYVCLWIDFNENQAFEQEEMLIENLYLKYASIYYTQNIVIPTFVNSGEKRVRVRCNYNDDASDPCSDFAWGETEDYTVFLGGGQDGWLTVNPLSADVLPGDSALVEMKLNANRLEKGDYNAITGISSNDPDAAYFEIPVLLQVFNILADFEASNLNILTGDSINFQDISPGNPISWLWHFEGGTPPTSTVQNPLGIQYNEAGTYNVSLEVSNGYDTAYKLKSAYVHVAPREVLTADFTSDYTVIDEGGAVHFFSTSTGNPTFFAWSIPGGTPEIIYIPNPIIIFHEPGLYDVTLYVSGDSMSDEITKHDYIEVLEVVSNLPPGWDYTTSIYQHLLVIPQPANPRIIETPLNAGDYIGVFYTNPFGQKICGGAAMWTGDESIAVIAQGDDPFTPFKDGFSYGEAFEWRFYSYARGRDFVAVAQYDPSLPSDGVFLPMAMSALTDIYAGVMFELVIPQGWSGVSIPVDPWYPEMDVLFEPVMDNLVMVYNNSGIFWPENNINTLVNWNVLSGYTIKALQADTVFIEGYQEKNLSRGLATGWNYLSVPVNCEKDVVSLFAANVGKLTMIREIAGINMYWPQFSINTLGVVKPGKSYLVCINQPFNLQFPICSPASQNPAPASYFSAPVPENPWNIPGFTASVHSIALTPHATSQFVDGDVVGVFDASDACYGLGVFDGQSLAVTAFGDDASTQDKDGFQENEIIFFKVFRPAEGEFFDLMPEFDPSLPNTGTFATYGMSAIVDLKLTLGLTDHISRREITIFPNPSDGKFVISGIAAFEKICITDLQGREIFSAENEARESITVDLTSECKGVFFVRMISGNEVVVRRVVVR